MKPCRPCRLVNAVNRGLLTGGGRSHDAKLGVGRRGEVKLTKFGKSLSILREQSKERPFDEI